MALPYPFEAETGELQPRQPHLRVAFDVEASVEAEIRANGSNVEVFGAHYPMEDAAIADATVEYYRNMVTLHFNERVSAPDPDIWQLFADQANNQLEHHPELDDSVLDMLRLTIDNL
jgi:hypothetical protein